MQFPVLNPPGGTQLHIRRFLGYDRSPMAAPGAFWDMENLCADRAPQLTVRPAPTQVEGPDGRPLTGVEALGGDRERIWINRFGDLWAGEYCLPQFVPRRVTVPRRQLVMLGGWVCVFPDGLYANAVRLAQGQHMTESEDYGSIRQDNSVEAGLLRLAPCTADGTEFVVTRGSEPPADGAWLDTSEEHPVIKRYSQSQGLWLAVECYTKLSLPGIAKGLHPGDGVELTAQLGGGQAEDLLLGAHVLTAALHDPGAADRAEGAGDYLVYPGLISQVVETTLVSGSNHYVRAQRPLPEMDFVVSCKNRLWGCRAAGQVHELYGCKLGDFRNWSCFQGLSSDSWRASRGEGGPFTAGAVLDGCVLFFRADGVEKLVPSHRGDHRVLTYSLEGVEEGSDRSVCLVGSRLYYKSPGGVCCYNGTLPVRISAPLGPERYHDAVAGTWDGKYYLCLRTQAGEDRFFVYDTGTGLWHRWQACRFEMARSLPQGLELLSEGSVLQIGPGGSRREVRWWAETRDLDPLPGRRARIRAMQLWAELEPGAEATVLVSYDGGPWQRKGRLMGNRPGLQRLPLQPRRCDRLRLRLEGVGGLRLEGISLSLDTGSRLD